MPSRILGISAFYHDSAAALVATAHRRRRAGRALHPQEARRTVSAARDPLLPRSRPASNAADVDHVVFYEKPFLKFERLLETYLAFAPRGFALVPHGDAAVAEGKAVPEAVAAATT